MISNYKIFMLCGFAVVFFTSNTYSQELLTPSKFDLSDTCFQGIVPIKYAGQMTIYYEMGNTSYTIYYDELQYDLVALSHNFCDRTTTESRCQILRRPFSKETPASVFFDLVSSAVFSSSYCSGEVFGINTSDLLVVSYSGYSAFSNVKEGNCLKLKNIISKLYDNINNGELNNIYEQIPEMKELINIFHGYYPIPTECDSSHKSIPALQ